MATTVQAGPLHELLGSVGEAMVTDVLLLAADADAETAVRQLERTGVSGAPVVDRGHVVGVVTLSDLVRRGTADDVPVQTHGPFLRHEHALHGLRIGQVMSSSPVTLDADWPLARAVLAMAEARVNRLPVVDRYGQPVGIIARDDVIRALAARLRAELGTAARGSQLPPD